MDNESFSSRHAKVAPSSSSYAAQLIVGTIGGGTVSGYNVGIVGNVWEDFGNCVAGDEGSL